MTEGTGSHRRVRQWPQGPAVTAGSGSGRREPRPRHVHRHELQQQELLAAAAGQGRVPAGSPGCGSGAWRRGCPALPGPALPRPSLSVRRRVQRLQGALHGVSPPQRLRERGVPAERHGLPAVPHGQASEPSAAAGGEASPPSRRSFCP